MRFWIRFILLKGRIRVQRFRVLIRTTGYRQGAMDKRKWVKGPSPMAHKELGNET